MESQKTYSPADVMVVIGDSSPVIIEVFNSVEIAMEEDKISHSAAATGQSTRVINASKLGTITLTLPQTTKDNEKILKEYKKILKNYAKGAFTMIDVRDKLGQSKHIINRASINRVANSNYEKESSNRAWAFTGDVVDNDVTGNEY
jgi:hypothetical protein